MRTKSFLALTLCALALTACSSAQAPEETAPTETVTATPEAEQMPAIPVDPTEAYLESARNQIAQHSEYFDEELPHGYSADASLVETGEEICEKSEAGELRAAPSGLPEAEAELEKVLRGPATGILCPSN